MGELNSKLLGIIFVMKFQAAAMGRADVPENQREDFSLYVDEFQNFATESFESILSEARKYRLNLILGNQFMTQLTDKIREAIIGNVGTVISGRIGITDAEILVKKFAPTFDAEDLTKMPNYQSVTSVMINNVPSAPFSMSFLPPMGEPNAQLSDALKRLSAAKYGKPRAQVEREIFARLGAGEAERKAKADTVKKTQQQRMTGMGNGGSGSSFLDEWLAKRQQIGANSVMKPGASSQPQAKSSFPAFQGGNATPTPFSAAPPSQVPKTSVDPSNPFMESQSTTIIPKSSTNEDLRLRGDDKNHDSEISIKLR
jgi:hypothetical protein